MGGGNSKSSNLSRNNSTRQSQRRVFQRIKKKFDAVQKDLKAHQGDANSPSYLKIKAAILNIKFELEETQKTLKDKHKKVHEEWTKKVEELSEELDEKAGTDKSKSKAERRPSGMKNHDARFPAEKSSQSVELTLIQLAMEKKNSEQTKKYDEINELENQKLPPNIEILRQEVLRLRKIISAFKGEKNDDDYLQIKDRLINIFIDMDNVNISHYPQLRREKQLGLDDVQSCFRLLEEVTDTNRDYEEVPEEYNEDNRSKFKDVVPTPIKIKIQMNNRAENIKDVNYSSEDDDDIEYEETNEDSDPQLQKKPVMVTSF